MSARRGGRRHSSGSTRAGRGGRSLIELRTPSFTGRSSIGVVAVGAVVVIALLLAGADAAVSWDRIHPGVSVGGIDVGGMRVSDARAIITREVEPRLALPVSVAHGSRRWTITAARAGARLDAGPAVTAAWAVGREGSIFDQVGGRVGAWFGRRALPLSATAEPRKLESIVGNIARSVFVPARDAGVKLEGTQITRVMAASGTRARTSEFKDDLLAAFTSKQRIVTLATETLPARVADADADQAFRDAGRMISADATLTYQAKTWDFVPARLAQWVSFAAVPYDETSASASVLDAVEEPSAASVASTDAPVTRHVLKAFMSAREVSSTLTPLVGVLGKPAKDARFRIDGESVSVVPGQVGTGVDMVGVADDLTRALTRAGDRTVAMRLQQTQPTLTTAQARSMGVKGLVSSYSTDYDPGNAPRVSNIHTLARALDGKLVPPGGTFSFNGAVGERTAEKGYEEAPAIVNGKLVPQLGGGICQIGTTFFNAVFFSGLPVVERTNHSFYISHYPKGRDCTVSWGGPDFRWKNDTKAWILVKTDYSDSSITISLYGADPGYKVTYTTSDFTNVTPYATNKENDPTLELGKTVSVESGVDGRRVVVVRTVTSKGAIVRKDTFTSVYQPKDATVKVGTKPPSTPATSTVDPKKKPKT